MDVPVVVEIREQTPHDDLADWDHVVEASIELMSGRLVIAGCPDYFPDAKRINIAAGWSRARVFTEHSFQGIDAPHAKPRKVSPMCRTAHFSCWESSGLSFQSACGRLS
ncbi:hypothetical protein DLREEDagr8_21030 [Dongia sp. agr-C8]